MKSKSINVMDYTRKELRYSLYRIKNEITGGCKAELKHRKFKKLFESMDGFGDWEYFAELWDVGPEGYQDKIVKLKKGIAEKWEDKLSELAIGLPTE